MSEPTTPATVVIGGREVPVLIAALIAQEASRLDIPPGQVGDVVIPEPTPDTVEIAGCCAVSIDVGAQLAARRMPRGCSSSS